MLGVSISLTGTQRRISPFASLMPTLLSGASQLIAHPLEYGSMFQDRAGTTPVTAPGQLVGHVLDAGPGGYHATAVSDAARGFFAVVPETGRRNLLTYTEEFDNADWGKTNSTVTANATTAPDGTVTADKLVETATGGVHHVNQNDVGIDNEAFTVTIYVKAAERDEMQISVFDEDSTANGFRGSFDLVSETATTSVIGAGIAAGSTITDSGGGFYRLSVSGTANPSGTGGTLLIQYRIMSSGAPSYTGDGTSGIYIWGAQLEESSTATDYQRVGSQYDVTEAGVRSLRYVAYNGVNTGYETPVLPAPGVDKAQVFAGVRKLSGAVQMVAELSVKANDNAGSFYHAINDSARLYSAGARGSAAWAIDLIAGEGTGSPDTATFTGLHDIAGNLSIVRRNGEEGTNATGDKGSGNFNPSGTYPLYYGTRAGTEKFFDGHHYGTLGPVVRFGTNATAGQIAAAEAYYTKETGL